MVKNLVKKNQASMQVIKTLNTLLEDNYAMRDLIEKLNENEEEPVFNNSVVSKYINTCRYVGIEIPKIHNKYFVASMPFGMDLSSKDLELFQMMQEVAKNTISAKQNKYFDMLLSKISKHSNKHIIRIDKNNANIIYEKFEKAINEKRKIKLMFKVKATLECIPLRIIQNKNKIYFNILVDDKEQMIKIDRITGLEILNVTFSDSLLERTVVYKLTGGLAKRYSLRDNETLINDSLPDYIVVSNAGESQEVLLSRLLRYDKDCEILSPKECKDDMAKIIDETLANYGE